LRWHAAVADGSSNDSMTTRSATAGLPPPDVLGAQIAFERQWILTPS